MNVLVVLVPVSIFLSALALLGFLWTLRSNQYEDLEGDSGRILLDPSGIGDHEDTPAPDGEGRDEHSNES